VLPNDGELFVARIPFRVSSHQLAHLRERRSVGSFCPEGQRHRRGMDGASGPPPIPSPRSTFRPRPRRSFSTEIPVMRAARWRRSRMQPRRVDELRAIVGVLREGDTNGAPLRPSPGIDDLPELVRRTHDDGVAVHMAIVGDAPQRLQEAVSLAVYRIVQESLTNARRHYPGAAVQFAAPGRRGLGSWSESPLVAGARATVTRRPRRRSPYLRPEGLLRRPLPPSRSVCRPECRGATRIGADCPQPVRRRRWPAIQPGRSLWRSGTEPGRRSAPPPTASSPQAPPARP
jgi:hypothetical protein